MARIVTESETSEGFMANVLYYGDNLDILRRYVGDESVDLIYLDPPFKSDQNYNVLFKEKDEVPSDFSLKAS
jgi:site-specific DNA-methyltransferase (adenine-specific)